MEISIAGYQFKVVILLLIAFMWVLMAGHTICGCCKVEGFEGFSIMGTLTDMVKGLGSKNKHKDKLIYRRPGRGSGRQGIGGATSNVNAFPF